MKDWIIVNDVPPGEYTFKFISPNYRIKGTFFLPEKDTLSVFGGFWEQKVSAVLIEEYHRNVAHLDSIRAHEDSIAAEKFKADKLKKAPDPNSNGSDPYTVEDEFEDEEIFYIVEQMPTFNNGDPALEFRKYIAMNLRYPDSAAEKGIKGRVLVQFAVDSKGRVCDVTTVAGVHPLLDKEAMRVVSSSPLWQPGKQRGKAVKVLFTFPINFRSL